MLSRLAQAPGLGLAASRLATRGTLSSQSKLASPLLRTTLQTNSSTSTGLLSLPAITGAPSDVSRRTFISSTAFLKSKNRKNFRPSNEPRESRPEASRAQEKDDVVSEPKDDPAADPAKDEGKEPETIPFDKLPDLTQGIPSTFEQEMQKGSSKSESALEAVEQSGGDRGGRERADSYIPTSERNRKWWTRFGLISVAVGSVGGIMYLGRGWADEEEAARHSDIPNGWTPGLWWQRVRARWTESVSYYKDPAFEKLLPDPDPSFERPYTLCLSLEDMLVFSEWSREHGWRIAKRPGLDYFIRYLSQYYELVLFTSVGFAYAEPLMRKLDPYHFIMWPLFREATKFEDGEIVKDLSYLNRDLSKVIMIDTKAHHVRKQLDNAIVLEPWKGDPNDKGLVALIPFLEYIHTMQYEDVRKVLKSFEGKDIPTEFARREALARKEFNARRSVEKAKHSKPSGFGALGSALGMKSSNMSMTMSMDGEQSASEAFAQGKMLQDIARERGQKNYEMLEQQIRENGETWLKEEAAAMEKANAEAMNNMMGSFSGWFTPKPKDGN